MILDQTKDIGIGHSLERIVIAVASSMKRRLEVDAKYGRMFQSKSDYLADLVVVYSLLNRRDQNHWTSGLSQAIEGGYFFLQDIWFSPDEAICFRIEAIKLEVNSRLDFG